MLEGEIEYLPDRAWRRAQAGSTVFIPPEQCTRSGFALGAFHVSLPVAAIVIGGVSVALSLLGLELGARIGARVGGRGEILGGLVLIGVGAAVAAGLI